MPPPSPPTSPPPPPPPFSPPPAPPPPPPSPPNSPPPPYPPGMAPRRAPQAPLAWSHATPYDPTDGGKLGTTDGGVVGPTGTPSPPAALPASSGTGVGVVGPGGTVGMVTNNGEISTYDDETGGFVPAGSLPDYPDDATSVTFGDVDGDGDMDIVVTTGPGSYSRLYINDGEGGFGTFGRPISQETLDAQTSEIVDLNGDGFMDIIVGNADGKDYVYYGPAPQGRPGAELDDLGGVGNKPPSTSSIATGDIDGDGDIDIVIGSVPTCSFGTCAGGSNYVQINNGDGTFTAVPLGGGDGTTMDVELADVDGDGHLDVVTGNHDGVDVVHLSGGAPLDLDDLASSGSQLGSEVLPTTDIEVTD